MFCIKYRYRILTGQTAVRTREIIREVCTANYVNIVSGNITPGHVHMLISMSPSMALSKYIKGKSNRKLLQEFEYLRKRYWGQRLWAGGYFAVTVGNVNATDVHKYIAKQGNPYSHNDFNISEF